MEKSQIKKAVRQIKYIGMTANEKSAIMSRIIGSHKLSFERVSWYRIIKPPFFTRQTVGSIFAIVLLILMLAGGGVAFASEDTLPGDLLYPVKITVIEPIRDTLAFSASAKVYLEELKIQKRLKEAAILASQGRLTDAVERQIQMQVEAGIDSIGRYWQERIGEK